MPDNGEMLNAERERDMAIAELRTRIDGHDIDIAKLDAQQSKHEEMIGALRESAAKVATKDDVSALRDDINKTFYMQLRDAHNSIPGKVGVWLTGGSVLIALAALLAGMLAHHG